MTAPMMKNEIVESAELDRRRARRSALEADHSQRLTTLLGKRIDLRGVHALADNLDDAVRWTA